MTSLLTGRKVTVIGGAGFIGHNLALELARRGVDVDVVDSLQVNNLLAFSSFGQQDASNRELYLRIIHQRLEMLRQAGISLHVLDARDYYALTRILVQICQCLKMYFHSEYSKLRQYKPFWKIWVIAAPRFPGTGTAIRRTPAQVRPPPAH